MKIVVTGSTGFSGKALVEELAKLDKVERVYGVNRKIGLTPESLNRAKSDKVVNLYCCLDNEAYVQSLFNAVQPDIIFHAAAVQKNTFETYHMNTTITHNLLKHCPRETRFVYISSSTIYGNQAQSLNRKCKEYDNISPTSYYGTSKASCEFLVGTAHLAEKIKSFSIIRPCAIVGVGATHGALQDIIKKAGAEGDSLELWGDSPGVLKPYVHISDVINTLLHFGLDKNATGVFNVCPSDSITIDKLADIVIENLGVKKTKVWNPNKKALGDNRLVAMDNSKAREAGWEMKYSTSEEAVAAVVSKAHV